MMPHWKFAPKNQILDRCMRNQPNVRTYNVIKSDSILIRLTMDWTKKFVLSQFCMQSQLIFVLFDFNDTISAEKKKSINVWWALKARKLFHFWFSPNTACLQVHKSDNVCLVCRYFGRSTGYNCIALKPFQNDIGFGKGWGYKQSL